MVTFSLTTTFEWVPGHCQLYKFTDSAATYEPCAPYLSTGRFGKGDHKTLYVAVSPDGAVAEFLRRHPELIGFQDALLIRVWELDLDVNGSCIDVRENALQALVGISEERLTSSDASEDQRYAECRDLAEAVLAAHYTGIGYPSAAASWPTWNLVLFGDQARGSWECAQHREVSRPRLAPAQVRTLN